MNLNLDNKYTDNKYIFDGNFGLERETLRVTADGALSQKPHPFKNNRYLDRDFCENQLELITPVCPNIEDLMTVLQRFDDTVRQTLLNSGEYMWLCSNPPHINSESDIPIADFGGKKAFKHDYRVNLERRYGKRLMLYSGIHFNFSFSEKLLGSLYARYDGEGDYKAFKNALYFRLLKQVFRYSWFLVLLTASSPVYDLSLDGDGLRGSGFEGYSSMRNSQRGYWNQFVPIIDYTDLNTYINSVNNYVNKGMLFSAGELYLPVRLKPEAGSGLSSLVENGVNHIELRMFDLNPLSKSGVFREDLEFAHYFLIYLLSLPDFDFTPEGQNEAVKNHQSAARYVLSEITINNRPASEVALEIIDDMSRCFEGFERVLKIINIQREKIVKNERYCVKVYNELARDFQGTMLDLTKEYGGVSHV